MQETPGVMFRPATTAKGKGNRAVITRMCAWWSNFELFDRPGAWYQSV